MYKEIIRELESLSEPAFAKWLRPFLSIDENSDEVLLGVRTPILRKLAKKYKNLSEKELQSLLSSNIHESRALAIFVMLIQTKKEPQRICSLYLKNIDRINNWDLVDYSAPHIVAPNVDTSVLRELACSDYLWANRVAMVSTIFFIKRGDFSLALEFAERFMTHPHHLMHKAAGWMLREVGKKDVQTLLKFLERCDKKMPAVMRSYAKEKLCK